MKNTNNNNKNSLLSLKDCNTYDLLYIFNKYIVDDKIKPYKDNIMLYLIKNKINGATILKTTRKQFAQDFFRIFHNTKINEAAITAYDKIIKFNVDEKRKQATASYIHYK